MNDHIPIDAIPKSIRPKVTVLNFKKIDSYNPKAIITQYPFYSETIKQRVYHSETKTAYIAALGSIPYLYLIGTIFRNGHLPLQTLEHDRNRNKWHLLEPVGIKKSLRYRYANKSDRDEILQIMKNAHSENLGIAISFTNKICPSELPEIIRDQTIAIDLNSTFEFDAIPCESEQDDVTNEIAHFLTSISKYTNRIHLFICAQASVVIKLGQLYQDGMMGNIVVHNYTPASKLYSWAIRFDGLTPVIEKERQSD